MKTYRKTVDFIYNHLLLFALTIVIFVLTVFVCVDGQRVMMGRTIVAFVLWSAALLYVAMTEIKKRRIEKNG